MVAEDDGLDGNSSRSYPRLGIADLDRLWGLVASSSELSIQQLLLFQGTSNVDPWGESCLRRMARRLAPAMGSPANFFQRFNLTGSGMLSYAEFERMVMAQDGQVTREDVGALWPQLEGMTTSQKPQPSSVPERDMILEARVAQMERSFRNRGVSLLQACQMMDVARIGFLDRSGSPLRQLMSAAGVDLAGWEQEDLIRRCDTGRNGLPGASKECFESPEFIFLDLGCLQFRVN
eukprot:g15502.t1